MIKLITIAMGLVALGIGQVQAQKPEVDTHESWSLRLPDNDTESWSMRLFEPLATMITTAKIRVIGRQRLYQCEDGMMPPNCRYNDPPADINQCGSWSSTFRVIWGVQCPPIFPTQFIYWMDRCSGGYSEVTRWTLHPSGTCANGYYDANSTLEGTNPDCMRRGPLPQCTPPPCNGHGWLFNNRWYLTKTAVFSGTGSCGTCSGSGNATVVLTVNNDGTITNTCSGSATKTVDGIPEHFDWRFDPSANEGRWRNAQGVFLTDDPTFPLRCFDFSNAACPGPLEQSVTNCAGHMGQGSCVADWTITVTYSNECTR